MSALTSLPGLLEILRREEGLRLKPYRCTKGKLTIGYGHNLDANGISQAVAEVLLREDADAAVAACEKLFPSYRTNVSKPRQAVLACMAFQLGAKSLAGFTDLRKAVLEGRWDDAAAAMLDSQWARKDTPERARRMAELMRRG